MIPDKAVEAAAVAIAREGFPKGREGAGDYRMRLARAALTAAAPLLPAQPDGVRLVPMKEWDCALAAEPALVADHCGGEKSHA